MSNEFYGSGEYDSPRKGRPSMVSAKQDLMQWFRTHMERGLLMLQLFYLFFYAAFGSLFPLISIYFKQLGMSPTQCGIISAVRSLMELLATPFWNALAEKWKKGKAILIASLIGSMSFTLGLGFVRPAPEGCLVRLPQYGNYNQSLDKPPLMIVEPYRSLKYDSFRSVDMTRALALNLKNRIGQSPLYLNTKLLSEPSELLRNKLFDKTILTKSIAFTDPSHYPTRTLVMPLYSTVVYLQTKVDQIFILIIILVLFGELFSCPALPLVDALVAQKTRVRPSALYGQQRISGSIGWGLAMFFIGLALDNASSFPDYPCLQPGKREKNYMVCFATYSVFMAFAMFTSTQFSFVYEGGQESMYYKVVKDKLARTLLGRTTKNRSRLVNEPESEETVQDQKENDHANPSATSEHILEQQLGIKLDNTAAVKLQSQPSDAENFQNGLVFTTQLKVTKWFTVCRLVAKPHLLLLIFITWFTGLGVGQVFTFLFWHVQELDGSPTLFGIATVINHISEVFMYNFSPQIIDRIGHVRVLYIGLLANVVRFLYVSWITNPWWILPFEFLQGFTHAGVWVACCSYLTQSLDVEHRSTIQSFLHGIHYGLGRGLGACFGGLVISSYGSTTMFRSYGAASAVVLVIFLLLNYVIPVPTGRTESADIKNDAAREGDVIAYGQVANSTANNASAAYPSENVKHEYYMQQ